jgi:hypothetical protein
VRQKRIIALAIPRYVRLCFAVSSMSVGTTAALAGPPAIRTSDYNKVPACVTPARLMHFLRERNPKLEPRYDEIARWYKTHGETWRVRWDYAFFQMIIETNHLMYRTGNGRQGDVNPKQNNFAGIGTTGGGVPGDGYPDVSTGVLAQIQHLVAYSGERMDKPVANRTQLRQDDIIAASARLRRTVTFGDLAGRWAVDRRYWRSIEYVADRFRAIHCSGHSPIPDEPEPPKLVKKPTLVAQRARPTAAAEEARPIKVASIVPVAVPAPAAAPKSAAAPLTCRIGTASFVGKGGQHKALLIRAQAGDEVQFTAVQVLDGFQRSMAESFIRSRAPGGSLVAEYDTSDDALAQARSLCPQPK